MKILLTNDDGIDSAGLTALASSLSGQHELYIVAPRSQRSASAHAITVHSQIEFDKQPSKYSDNCYAVSGTPADCVKLAALFLFKDRLPDLVIAGINEGSNIGCDTIYSGTVSAALEAAYMNLRGIAVSLYSHSDGCTNTGFGRAADFIKNNLDELLSLDVDARSVLNINHPDGESAGKIVTKLAYNYYSDYYAIDKQYPNRVQLMGRPNGHSDTDTDVSWAEKNYITVTPVTLDKNDYASLGRIKGYKFR